MITVLSSLTPVLSSAETSKSFCFLRSMFSAKSYQIIQCYPILEPEKPTMLTCLKTFLFKFKIIKTTAVMAYYHKLGASLTAGEDLKAFLTAGEDLKVDTWTRYWRCWLVTVPITVTQCLTKTRCRGNGCLGLLVWKWCLRGRHGRHEHEASGHVALTVQKPRGKSYGSAQLSPFCPSGTPGHGTALHTCRVIVILLSAYLEATPQTHPEMYCRGDSMSSGRWSLSVVREYSIHR